MDTFTTNEDLQKLRPEILKLGVSDFEDQHLEAFRIINRELIMWQYQSAISRVIVNGIVVSSSMEETVRTLYPYDVDKFLNWEVEIKPAAIRLGLSLVYVSLSKDLPLEEDGMASQAKFFREEYEREWALAVRSGFSYDWDASGTIDPGELQTSYRSLVRQ